MNCYPVFFNVVQDSLINSAITITMKLYDKNRDSFTISKVINTLENNKDIFLNEYESIYHFPENSKMEADKITFTIDKLKLFEIAKEKIIKDIKLKNLKDLFNYNLIPKKIHFFWFGGNPKSEIIKKCIESWKKYAPDFEIIEWTEENCDVNECQYVKEAYEAKKWAFVSDYFRTKKVYEYGGIYLDTDMELTKPIHSLTLHSAFFHFETNNVAAGIFGATKENFIIKEWYESYLDSTFIRDDGTYDTSNTIVVRLTKILNKRYKINYNCENQFFDDGVGIYAPDYLMIDVYNGNNIAIHHYDASWWDSKVGMRSYKYDVLECFFEQKQKLQKGSFRKTKKFLRSIFEKFVRLLRKILPKKIFLFFKKIYHKIIDR